MNDKPLPLEKQVVSLELAKRMKELGAPQKSYFKWCLWDSPNGAVLWDEQTAELATDIPVKTALGILEKGISATRIMKGEQTDGDERIVADCVLVEKVLNEVLALPELQAEDSK